MMTHAVARIGLAFGIGSMVASAASAQSVMDSPPPMQDPNHKNRVQPRFPEPLTEAEHWYDGLEIPAEVMSAKGRITVNIVIGVSANGKVETCSAPSNYEELNARLCAALKTNLRFHPAADSYGKPMEGKWRTRFVFEVTDDSES